MNQELKKYYNNLQKPWSQLFYEIVNHQLSFINNRDILDFGSGFGILSDALAQNNRVTAIEPNEDMINNRIQNNKYIQITGGLPELKKLADNSFDVIIFHNVLE